MRIALSASSSTEDRWVGGLRSQLVSLALLAWCVLAGAQTLPARPSGPVADYANVVDAGTRARISTIAQALWEQAGFSLIVAVFPDIGDEPVEDFAVKLYKEWGIGTAKMDEGALILISLKPRKARIEVGYGAEGYLNDAKAGRILDEYGVQLFRANRYAEGLLAVSSALATTVAHEKNITLAAPASSQQRAAPPEKMSVVRAILVAIVVLFLLATPFGRSILFAMVLSGALGGRRQGGGGFGGGFGGGGFGGGFGGGMSGGGGASRGF